jgi:hypothetical protein
MTRRSKREVERAVDRLDADRGERGRVEMTYQIEWVDADATLDAGAVDVTGGDRPEGDV